MTTFCDQMPAHLKSLFVFILVLGFHLVLAASTATGLTIIREYIPPGKPFEFDGLQVRAGKAPTQVVGGGNLVAVFNAAADVWEGAIGDDHTVTIQFGWSPIPLGHGVHSVRSQGGLSHRITEAVVYFDNDGSTMWFLDQSPGDHSEYPIVVDCYTSLNGTSINSGHVLSDGVGAPQAMDLLTIAKHEIGHALGLSTWNYQWTLKHADQGILMHAPRPYAGLVIPIQAGGHLRLHGALMDQSLFPRQRKLISVIDVLAIAEMGEFTDLDLTPEHYPDAASGQDGTKAVFTCPPGL